MQHSNSSPARLVQIEPLKKSAPPSSPEPQIPTLADGEVYRRKTEVVFRRIIGFVYAKHSYSATRRWMLARILPDKVLYRWKPYQRGGCNRCGLCCKIVFRCPFFYEDGQTTACMI